MCVRVHEYVCVLLQASSSCLSDPPRTSVLPVGHGSLSSVTHQSINESLALQSKESSGYLRGLLCTLSSYQSKETGHISNIQC